MNNEINEYLNINYKNIYKLDQTYINNLFLEIKTSLKLVNVKNYNLKKKNILKYIYQYFIDYLHIDPKVINLSKRKQPEQRSDAWYDMRYNMVSASDAATVIGKMENVCVDELKKITPHKPFKSKKDLIKTKILRNDEFKGNKYTQHGQVFEEVATLIYQKRENKYIIEFGLLKHPDIDIIGASPDGITQDGIMIEIKAPYSRVINGLIPSNYWIQMQLQLEVCDLDECHFVEIKSSMYDSEYDYYEDNHPDDPLLTSQGLEKGIIIKTSNNNSRENNYIYPHIDIYRNNDLLENWKKTTYDYNKNIFDNVEICYWRITKYLCTPVKRDKNWFLSNLYKFYDFWKDVDFYKNNKDKFDTDIQTKRKKAVSKNQICMISDSDSETEEKNKIMKQTCMIIDSDSDNEIKSPKKDRTKMDIDSTNLDIDLIVNDL